MIDDKVEQPPFAEDVFGMFDYVETVPTGVPKNFRDQIKIYTDGATLRLYWYDTKQGLWHYVTATA